MNTEQERAAFEAWAASIGLSITGKYAESIAVLCAESAFKAGYQAALQSQDREDALRYRYLTIMLQQAYDGECFETDLMTLYCYMSSQYKGNRIVLAEITWRDKSDEPIGLGEAIDHARRVAGDGE
jgi:hypothetical protein